MGNARRFTLFLALALAGLAWIATAWVVQHIFEGIPHLEDEYAYLWEAKVMARGDIRLPSPTCPRCFLVPFVVDYQGYRFGKYPPGWPAALSLAVRLGAPEMLNPFLAALCVWLTFRLVSRLLDDLHGLLAALLTLTSPFFLMNAGSLLSHTFSLFLTLAFALAWLDSTDAERPGHPWITVPLAGLSLGLLALTRPLTAIGVACPFAIHGVIILLKGNPPRRRHVLIIGALAALISSWLLLWQYALTGNPFLNPYTLWWPYDRIGFGPGIGRHPDGHQLVHAWTNTRFSLRAGSSDLFGWGKVSWLFMPFGLMVLRKKPHTWPVGGIAISLILAYMLYWIGAWVLGPRYYYEGIISATLFTAAGFLWLAGKLPDTARQFSARFPSYVRFGVVSALFLGLILANLRFYLPQRLGGLQGLYGASRSQLTPFLSTQAQKLAPALIIVHWRDSWREYGTLSVLSSPYMDSPFLFAISRGEETDGALASQFPQRKIWHYYSDTPYQVYTAPRSESSP